ncbi:MAG: carboxynorspermidine decarboxylase [Piscirickettsiaceae bacterium]|jgi:carboxynorspermidine decarboxylase|nr:carboxynorspermidine decarboxylase [Piscirickettsiaceae bacterium]
MQLSDFTKLDLQRLPSPCFVVDEVAVERNLAILKDVADRSGAKVLAALKAFSMWSLAPLTSQYLSGTCASGLHEAKLGQQEYGGEVHVFAAAYNEADVIELLTFAQHIVFNSCGQWLRFRDICLAAQVKRPELQFGLRVNPEHSEGALLIYDPCAQGSRLGITLAKLDEAALGGISGLHFHTLCEQGFEPLARTVKAVEKKFGHLLSQMDWVNFGGGHHITAEGYDVDGLVTLVQEFSERHQVQVYLEPGEAIAIGTGILSCEVLDLTWNQLNQAILDTSATCHMPDTLEMPYRPEITGAEEADVLPHTYRLGGLTCLAGDVIGDYSFAEPLHMGQRLIFEDMSHYTMVKTTTFNGTKLPSLAIWNSETDQLNIVKIFGYEDFKNRLS